MLLEFVRSSAPDLYVYLRLAVCTGARRSQLLASRWGDVDVDRSAVAFTRALVEWPDGPQLRPTKSRCAYRVALDAATLRVLVDYRRTVPAAVSADRFVFSGGADGAEPWKPNLVTKRFIAATPAPRPR